MKTIDFHAYRKWGIRFKQNRTKSGVIRRMKSMELGVLLIAVLLSAMAIAPLVSADEKNITINITYPEEGDTFYNDVQPAFIFVQGIIDAPQGIRNVSITNGVNESGYGEVICGGNYSTHFDLSCKIFMTDHVTITVEDKLGFIGTERRNFTNYGGPPPPGTIWVTGRIVDSKGKPIPNASVIFETIGENYHVTATTESGADGLYKMKKALGFNQRITVRKEGYQTFVREVSFVPYDNQFIITLEPQGTSVPGFTLVSAISAILVSLFLVITTRRIR